MRKLSALLVGCMVASMAPGASVAQPGSYGPNRPPPYGQPGRPDQHPQPGGHYYYNGRWVDQNEWQRHSAERDRWANNYQRRHRDRRDDRDNTGTALIAGI